MTDGDGEAVRPKGPVSWPFDPSFEAVLAAAQDGKETAFAQLYQSLNRRVHSFVLLRRSSDPEGTVNEVFLKVFRNLHTFTGVEGQFNAWVFAITRNTLTDEARRESRRPVEVELDPARTREADTSGDAESNALASIGHTDLLERLESLTADQREVVLLRIVGDLTIESIAQALDKEVGAVKALQRRAFRRLARDLSDEAVPK